MSIHFQFNLADIGWVKLKTLVDGFKNHRSSARTSSCKDINIWLDLDGNKVAELTLTQGKTTLIDYEDLEMVCSSNWSAARDSEWGYRAVTGNKDGERLLHRKLYAKEGYLIDHINEEFPDSYALDNREVNIRYTNKNTHNVRKYKSNTTGHPNIIFVKRSNKYIVQVRRNKRAPYCPYYTPDRLQEAIQCRDLFKTVLHDHRGQMMDDKMYEDNCKAVIGVYDGILKDDSKPFRDLKVLFDQIKTKKSLDLAAKISEIRERVKKSI